MAHFFEGYFKTISEKINRADAGSLETVCRYLKGAGREHKKVIIAGNGASAAISSHVSVDMTKNTGLRAINFNEYDLITCLANDCGYEKWIEKALELYAEPGDVIILISSSGSSENIINAARKAKEMGLKVVTLSGFSKDNLLKKLGDVNLWVDSNEYNIVETVHQTWLLAVVDKLTENRKQEAGRRRR